MSAHPASVAYYRMTAYCQRYIDIKMGRAGTPFTYGNVANFTKNTTMLQSYL